MFFKRVFESIKKLIHRILDKFKSPEMRIQDAIKGLKKEHSLSLSALAEIKSIYIDTKNKIVQQKDIAEGYEKNAIEAIKAFKSGKISEEDSDKHASKAIKLRLEALKKADKYSIEAQNIEETTDKIEKKVNEIQDVIENLENELNSLKARHNAAISSSNISMMLSSLGENNIKSIMQELKSKVYEKENLALAYNEMEQGITSVDHDINKAIGTNDTKQIDLFLTELKQEIDNLENNKE